MKKKYLITTLSFILSFNLITNITIINSEANSLTSNLINNDSINTFADKTLTLPINFYYTFHNNSNKSITITTNSSIENNKRYSFVKYDKDNNITDIKYSDYGNISLQPYEKIELSTYSTASSDDLVTVNYLSSSISNPIISNTALFHEYTINKGQSYTFYNNFSTTMKIGNNSAYNKNVYDFVAYETDNDIINAGKDQFGIFEISSNNKLKVTSNSENGLKIFIPFNYSSCASVDDSPALKTITLDGKTSFEINNKAAEINSFNPKQLYLLTNSSLFNKKYDFVYYINNEVSTYNTNSYGDLYLPKNSQIKITPLTTEIGDDKFELYIPTEYESFVKRSNEKCISNVDILPNTTLELNLPINLKVLTNSNSNNDIRFNSLIFNTSTSLIRNSFGYINIKKNIKTQIGVSNSDSLTLYLPTEYSNLNESNNFIKTISNPLLLTKQLNSNSKYAFINDSNSNITIFNNCYENSSSFNLSKYMNSNSANPYEVKDNYNATMSLTKDEKFLIQNGNSPIEFYIPYKSTNLSKKDFKMDGLINDLDLYELSSLYNNITLDSPKDLNSDGIIDISDLVLMCKDL